MIFLLSFSLPWNQRTLLGWIALNIFSAGAAPFYLIINYSFLAFFIGICEHHRVFSEFFGVLVNELNDENNMNATQSKEFLVELIYFNNMARKYVYTRLNQPKLNAFFYTILEYLQKQPIFSVFLF